MRIALWSNPVAGGWDPREEDTWGGGEEAIVCLAEALTRRGHQLQVFYGTPPTTGSFEHQGVEYTAYAHLPSSGFDVVIHRKTPQDAGRQIAKAKVLWTDQVIPFDATPFQSIIVASRFLERSLAAFVPQSAPRLVRIPDGYDPDLLKAQPGDEFGPQTILFCSSPDRGLEHIVDAWPHIASTYPHAQLLLSYGWDLFLRCGGDPAFVQRMETTIKEWPNGIRERVAMGRLTRAAMHKWFRQAGVWAYYCTGGEYFCQVAIKAQMADPPCIPVVKKWGALHETVWSGFDVDRPEDFATQICAALDPSVQEEWQKTKIAAPDCAQTWDAVAEQWEQQLQIAIDAGEAKTIIDVGHLQVLPNTPPLLPQTELAAIQRLAPGLAEWLGAKNPARPYLSQHLGFSFNRQGQICQSFDPAQADAAVIGWELEDAQESPTEMIRNLNLPDGIPVACLTSYGDWRARQRQRALSRRDVAEIFHRQPELALRMTGIDDKGNGAILITFRLHKDSLAERNLARSLAQLAPRETLAACFITRNSTSAFLRALRSLETIADQVVVCDTGSTDGTKALTQEWAAETGMPVTLIDGYSPRYCHDCQREHDIGEMIPGHRVAGFETPRNQSIAEARTDWILWLDCDEAVEQPEELPKFLHPNCFQGYAISQHHFSVQPPGNLKIDYPVRCFRRTPSDHPAGLFPYGDLEWPTFHPGIEQRFAGVVHEHPGQPPKYVDGINPVLILPDVWIAHHGYHTEKDRRGRFVRNWPLMCADRQKYPERRLGQFLWQRDLHHHLNTIAAAFQGQPAPPESVHLAEEIIRLWRERFVTQSDMFTADSLSFVTPSLRLLGRGLEVTCNVTIKKPEISGDEAVTIQFGGRVEDYEQFIAMLWARSAECNRWRGKYL